MTEKESIHYMTWGVLGNTIVVGERHNDKEGIPIPEEYKVDLRRIMSEARVMLVEGHRLFHLKSNPNVDSISLRAVREARCRVVLLDEDPPLNYREILNITKLFTLEQAMLCSFFVRIVYDEIDTKNIKELFTVAAEFILTEFNMYDLTDEEALAIAERLVSAVFNIFDYERGDLIDLCIIYREFEYLSRDKYQYLPQILEYRKRFKPNGKVVVIVGVDHLYSLSEMIKIAEESGIDSVIDYRPEYETNFEGLLNVVNRLLRKECTCIPSNLIARLKLSLLLRPSIKKMIEG